MTVRGKAWHSLATRVLVALALCLSLPVAAQQGFTLEQVRDYAFPSSVVGAREAGRVAWVVDHRGRQNVMLAQAPDFAPRQLTAHEADDGQHVSGLAISRDGSRIVYVRGGEHSGNWDRGLSANPASLPLGTGVEIFTQSFDGGAAVGLGRGDLPAISPDGKRVAFIRDGAIWGAPADGSREAEILLKTRGTPGELAWSPDGSALAFVADRGMHSRVGVYRDAATPLVWLAPSATRDFHPRWSPDSRRLLFVRRPTNDGPPPPYLQSRPHPWELWVADANTGAGAKRWASGETMRDSFPRRIELLDWAEGGRIVFMSYRDGWLHAYSLAEGSDEPLLLTAGDYQVEQPRLSADGRSIVYAANTGADPDDADRRHLYRVPVDRAAPVPLTAGTGSEWAPLDVRGGHLFFISTTAQRPPLPSSLDGSGRVRLLQEEPRDFPSAQLVTPKRVQFRAEDGSLVHGQLFEPKGASGRRPAVLFVHGGPQRQMLLNWHFSDYYANDYAVNQYLASRGYVVLAVNYRLGTGYGYEYHFPPKTGPRGASEYLDVRAAGRFLAALPNVDAARVGIYGGSYGGYMTAMALAHDSALFKAGVDIHGVHDWTADEYEGMFDRHFYRDDAEVAQVRQAAWASSPISAVDTWKSPVLFIHGDDDRNVDVDQTVALAQRLRGRGVEMETMIVVGDTHHWMRYEHQLQVNAANVAFLERHLAAVAP